MTEFQKMMKVSKKRNETKDCAVKAVAAVSNLSYDYIHQVFQECGRKHRKGTPFRITREVLKILNIWADPHQFKAKTITALGRELPAKGRFLVRTSGHILAAVDGKVIDWTEGRRHRIQQVYKVSF